MCSLCFLVVDFRLQRYKNFCFMAAKTREKLRLEKIFRKIFVKMFGVLKIVVFLQPQSKARGALAQLARALAWHARGHRFDSVMLHKRKKTRSASFFVFTQRHSLSIPEGNLIILVPQLPAAESHPWGRRWDRSLRRRRGCGRCKLLIRCWPRDGPPASALPCL